MGNASKAGVCLLSALAALSCVAGFVCAQTPLPTSTRPTTPSTPSSSPSKAPSITPSPHATPLPQATPFAIPSAPGPTPAPAATPASGLTSAPVSLGNQTPQSPDSLTLEEALRLANAQASSFQQAGLNERIAAEDVKQAQAAFLPKVSAPLSYIYTSPALGQPAGTPRAPSFIANNAIGEYEAFANVSGDFDIAGKLRASLARNRALLAAAHAGTEVARRALAQGVLEAYYGLALAIAQRIAAEGNLAAAEEFERIKKILGREPNFTELGIFSVMWSEHCSYKNSRKELKKFPTTGPNILVKAGEENAGVVDIGDGWAVAFKIESHNHPSAIEPFQGAATGVGGIIRDIFTMGARPEFCLNSLRFGPITDANSKSETRKSKIVANRSAAASYTRESLLSLRRSGLPGRLVPDRTCEVSSGWGAPGASSDRRRRS